MEWDAALIIVSIKEVLWRMLKSEYTLVVFRFEMRVKQLRSSSRMAFCWEMSKSCGWLMRFENCWKTYWKWATRPYSSLSVIRRWLLSASPLWVFKQSYERMLTECIFIERPAETLKPSALWSFVIDTAENWFILMIELIVSIKLVFSTRSAWNLSKSKFTV